jgi:succinyl-CoA synthetase beta subunit
VRAGAPRLLTELESAKLLAAAGIPVVPSHAARDVAQAQAAARTLGYPVVLKALAPGVAHKHDLGLVAVAIGSDAELGTRMAGMRSQLRAHHLDEAGTTWIVQPMLKAPLELIVGMTSEPGLGRFLMVGLGGLLAETLDTVDLFHIDHPDARIRHQLARSLTGRALEKFSGQPLDAAIEQVMGLLANLRRFLREHEASIDSIDINPLLVGPGVFTAVDALVVLTDGEDKAG